MTPDQRVADALADIRVELFRGNRDPRMVDEIAKEYGLEPSVLAYRLAKAYGSLEDLDRWQSKSIAMRATEARMKAAIYAYAETSAGVNIAKWLEERAGRPATLQEVHFADELWLQRTLTRSMDPE